MLNFNFTYAPGTTLQQMVGMEMAGRLWSSYLKDPVTINIHVGVVSSSTLPTNVIGGALPGIQADQQVGTVRDRLTVEAGNLNYAAALSGSYDGRSFDDKVAATWNKGTKLSTYVDFTVDGEFDSDLFQTSTLNVNRANAKAMGLSVSNTSSLDGYILFSNLVGARTSTGQTISWNYNYTGTPTSDQLDFLSTAVHEIGHVLGFVSGVDRPSWMTNTIDESQVNAFHDNANQQVRTATPLDLFRYTKSDRREMSYGILPGSSETSRYFSLDSGITKIADFSTGADTFRGGDGSQASHWKHGVASVMAPKLRIGIRQLVGALDLRAMDVIGWDLQTTSAGAQSSSLTGESRMLERGAQNAASLASTAINLSTLQSNAISSLATRASQSTSWITSNLTNTSVTLPTSLRRDRTLDVAAMILNSLVYNWGNETGDGVWQNMLNLYHSESLFSTLDEVEIMSFSEASERVMLNAVNWDEVIPVKAGLSTSKFPTVQALGSMLLPVSIEAPGSGSVTKLEPPVSVPASLEMAPNRLNLAKLSSIDLSNIKPQAIETLLWESSTPKTLRKMQLNPAKPEATRSQQDWLDWETEV
jgi:hypothetical protein